MGWKKVLGAAAGGVGGFLLGGPAGAIAGASAGYGAGQGAEDGKKADALNDKAVKQKELEYQQRAPMRRQGMQALGQIEAPMDLGNLGFNAANPFAAARGPAPSTASYGDWGRMTTAPEQIDQALSGVRPDEVQFADDALGATYIGKSGGKMRFLGASGKQYTNDDRNHAQTQIKDKYSANMGYATPWDQMVAGTKTGTKKTGLQPLGGGADLTALHPVQPPGQQSKLGQLSQTGLRPLGGIGGLSFAAPTPQPAQAAPQIPLEAGPQTASLSPASAKLKALGVPMRKTGMSALGLARGL